MYFLDLYFKNEEVKKAKKQPPGLILNRKSVNWDVILKSANCSSLNFGWCEYENKQCSWDICPFKVKDSFKWKIEK